MLSPYHAKLAIIDIETTDAAVAQALSRPPDIIDIAVLIVDREFSMLDSWQSLVRPPDLGAVTEFTTDLTGITRKMLETAPTWADTWMGFAKTTKYNIIPLVGWGIAADYEVLQHAYRKNHLGWPHAYPVLDALSMIYWLASDYGMVLQSWKLKDACYRFSVPVEERHRAMSGAVACRNVLRAAANFKE